MLVEPVQCCCTVVHFTFCYCGFDTDIHPTSRRLGQVPSRENSSNHPLRDRERQAQPFLSLKKKAECHVKESSRRYFQRRFGNGQVEDNEFGVKKPPNKKDPLQDVSDSDSPWNLELEHGGVSSRCRKLTPNTNPNPTMYSQERQQADTQHARTWKQERRDELSNSASARRLERGEDIQMSRLEMEFRNMQISHYRYLEKVTKKTCERS